MKHHTTEEVGKLVKEEFEKSLEGLLRKGARKMLCTALEMEVEEYIEGSKELRDEKGRRLVVRNGHHRERDLITGIGKIPIKQPRASDRREGYRFSSGILPRYMRRAPSIDALIPALYLKGVSSSSFPEALKAILGENAGGLSPTNIVRLKEIWEDEYRQWCKRDLSGKRYVYVWADGIYFKVRLEPDRPCILVIIGARPDGKKELIAVHDGHRESTLSWKEVLVDLKARGMKDMPALATGDGALGFWAALREELPATREQRCWVHKTANVLDKLPKRVQPHAKKLLHEMYLAPTKKEAMESYDQFLSVYEARYPKACECLDKDKDVLFTFYDFPAQHWRHIRSTNVIESTFGTVRHRTRQTKGCGSRKATMSMVYKLATEAEKRWKRLHGYKLISKVIEGVKFVDGEMKERAA